MNPEWELSPVVMIAASVSELWLILSVTCSGRYEVEGVG